MMKKSDKNIDFDELIGDENHTESSKDAQTSVAEYRRNLYKSKSSEEKIKDALTGFKFSLINYSSNERPDEIILLGEFINNFLKEINLKKGAFANYLEISPRNLNKYFNNDRKFTIEHIIKIENLFEVEAEILLEIQWKNELIIAKQAQKFVPNKLNLLDMLSV